jgi:signal transduction histidine kinase/ActR/RegA family two-component response regulator
MKNNSLRGQLTRASMLTTLVVLVLCAGALLAYELLTYRNFWVADLRTQADLLAHSTAAALDFNDPKAAAENLSLLKVQPRIRAAAIYRKDGRLFATYTVAGSRPYPPELGERIDQRLTRFDGPTLELLHPIEHDGERVGTVYLQAEHDVWARTRPYLAILAAVMAAGLAVAVLVFNRLLRRVTSPLQQMTDVAQEVMTHRNWALRAPATEYRDIAVLVNAFNGMLAEVEHRTGELEVEMAERVHAEQELRLADRRKDEFLATLAHELRNPLAPMTTALALMRLPAAPHEVRDKAVGILERQLRHMVRLIDDLLDVSRVTTGKLSLHLEPVELVALLRSVVELAQPAAVQRGVALAFEPAGQPLVVYGDPVRLAQVFSNLLNNACRYTNAGGRIDVSLGTAGSRAEVVVEDTGIGIEPAMQAKVFDLFEQGDKSLERGSAGLGIGLTLARQLVRLHGGEIRVHSEGADRGSRFTVALPLSQPVAAPRAAGEPRPAPAHAVPAVQAAPAGQTSAAAGLHVLLADDNVDFATSLAELLESFGCVVRVVHDGAAAVEAAAAAVPQVALLDIGMPILNGYDVARQLRARPQTRAIKLVAITGWGQPADKRAAEDAGFDRHLVKPVDLDQLLEILAGLGSGSRSVPA